MPSAGYIERMDPAGNGRFKVCGACRRLWQSWDEFVHDPEVKLLGLQALERAPEASALVFEHRCGSSVSVLTRRLIHLLPDDEGADLPSLRGTVECARHCLTMEDRAMCDRPCVHVRDRRLLRMVEAIHATRSPGVAG